ncbi:MAG TPA: hypothetical protein VK760_00175 [Candidatus Acidoferrales bacterium]|jgi:hypothetical protein|nr:hypothetical protein [Candidatus Acidoferrales bacterium]
MLLIADLRRMTAALALTALAACSGATTIPYQGQTAGEPGDPLVRTANASSPCDISGFWYFHGSCEAIRMKPKGVSVALRRYNGLTLKESFSKNFATEDPAFVIGEGTSAHDITGLNGGQTFPVYGSVACSSLSGDAVTCPGRAVLYNVIENAGSETVVFNATPLFEITKSPGFTAAKCQVVQLRRTGTRFVWLRLPIYGHPNGTKLTFKPWAVVLGFSAKTSGVFGFVCPA